MEQPTMEQIFGSYMAWRLNEETWIISFMNGTEYMYLLEGGEKALLIDTGYGAGNLRSFVETLTKLPVQVANTHFHPDHAAGNGEFREVWVHSDWKVDEPSVLGEDCPFDLSRLPYPDYAKKILHDNDSIELGGRTVKVMEARPAHCNSSLFFWDEKYGLFFCGDEYESAQTIMIDNSRNPDAPYDVRERLENLRENALDILKIRDQIAFLMPNHNGTPIAADYLEDYVRLVEEVFAGTAVIEDKLNHMYLEMDPRASKMCRVRSGSVSIIILKEEVMKVYGK